MGAMMGRKENGSGAEAQLLEGTSVLLDLPQRVLRWKEGFIVPAEPIIRIDNLFVPEDTLAQFLSGRKPLKYKKLMEQVGAAFCSLRTAYTQIYSPVVSRASDGPMRQTVSRIAGAGIFLAEVIQDSLDMPAYLCLPPNIEMTPGSNFLYHRRLNLTTQFATNCWMPDRDLGLTTPIEGRILFPDTGKIHCYT